MKKHPIIPCLLICLAFLLMGCNSTDYQKAVGLQEAGEYAQAASIFESLGDYEDSADRVLECKYSIAESYVDSGKYEEAIQAFSEIIEYSYIEPWDGERIYESEESSFNGDIKRYGYDILIKAGIAF